MRLAENPCLLAFCLPRQSILFFPVTGRVHHGSIAFLEFIYRRRAGIATVCSRAEGNEPEGGTMAGRHSDLDTMVVEILRANGCEARLVTGGFNPLRGWGFFFAHPV
jgi:hypothetical protein